MSDQENKDNSGYRIISHVIIIMKTLLIATLLITIFPYAKESSLIFDSNFFVFMLAGFLAQLVDGSAGMAYGITCNTFLLHFGIPPKLATAAVHTSEVFTTGVSGLSHLKFRNLDLHLFLRIVITGVIGAIMGAWLISKVFDGEIIRPYVAAYLLILGLNILIKGTKKHFPFHTRVKHAEVLAFFGGLLDAVGGGGWGPIVASNILNQGKNPRETIGTVNTAEFFVTFASTGIFLIFVGVDSWQIVLGLILGGILAAPLGALIAKTANRRLLMILIGIIIVATSAFTIIRSIF